VTVIELDTVATRITTRQGRPVVHENGFIQYPLTPDGSLRLHVWPDVPITKQASSSPIHDHRFGFVSTILLGTLDHIVYIPYRSPRGPYQLANVVRGRLVIPDEHYYSVRVDEHLIVRTGEVYGFLPKRFHDSRGRGLTVTLMEKTKTIHDHTVRVLTHREEPPDNAFRRDRDLDQLWTILDRVVEAGALA